jgi:hypothetical protein
VEPGGDEVLQEAFDGVLADVGAGPAVGASVEVEYGVVGLSGEQRTVVAGVESREVVSELEPEHVG